MASVPASVTVAAGATTAAFTVNATAVAFSANATITATYGNQTQNVNQPSTSGHPGGSIPAPLGPQSLLLIAVQTARCVTGSAGRFTASAFDFSGQPRAP